MDNKKYVTNINGIDLFNTNTVQCSYLIFNVENVHPAIISKVEKWQREQNNNLQYWSNPVHC